MCFHVIKRFIHISEWEGKQMMVKRANEQQRLEKKKKQIL